MSVCCGAARTKFHRLGDFNNGIVVSLFWMLEIPDHIVPGSPTQGLAGGCLLTVASHGLCPRYTEMRGGPLVSLSLLLRHQPYHIETPLMNSSDLYHLPEAWLQIQSY